MAGKDAGGSKILTDILRELKAITGHYKSVDKRLDRLEQHLGVPRMTFTNHPYLQRSDPDGKEETADNVGERDAGLTGETGSRIE